MTMLKGWRNVVEHHFRRTSQNAVKPKFARRLLPPLWWIVGAKNCRSRCVVARIILRL
jgi:hypothetical protein